VLVREADMARVYLNGKLEIECKAPRVSIPSVFFGGRSDNDSNWEGRLDEIAVFDRALSAAEIAKLGRLTLEERRAVRWHSLLCAQLSLASRSPLANSISP
jgi:hypothetical protein